MTQVSPRPVADIPETLACLDRIAELLGPRTRTTLADGIARFGHWFLEFHDI